MLTTTQQKGTLTIRFTSGVCYRGIDYGPNHVDRPVTMPAHEARWYVQRGVARVVDTTVGEQREEKPASTDVDGDADEAPKQKGKRVRR